jgi:hypothetical protein
LVVHTIAETAFAVVAAVVFHVIIGAPAAAISEELFPDGLSGEGKGYSGACR